VAAGSSSTANRRASPGDIVLLRTAGQGRGHARILRRIGRPDVARDVIEALMLARGSRAASPTRSSARR